MTDKKVVVIGGGVAGLAAATALADLDIEVEIVERSPFAGGHGIRYTCKATEQCVKCGACMVEEKLGQAVAHPKIRIRTGTQLTEVAGADRDRLTLTADPLFVDPQKCNSCGLCHEECPAVDAVRQGVSQHHTPFYAINGDNCLYLKDGSCRICQDVCPQAAIDLDAKQSTASVSAAAIILATGFRPYSPEEKPYGYGVFSNVVTNLELEVMLRGHGRAIRPNDCAEAERIAFVQCVGSRDAKKNHLWCSKVCCASALRMAALIKDRQPETDISCFYIDIQTFGRDFETFYAQIRQKVRMIRAIPGDIYPTANDGMQITYLDPATSESLQEDFDLVVLSVGLMPCQGTTETARLIALPLSETGFAAPGDTSGMPAPAGVFTAGAAIGPMGIAEAIASGGKAADQVMRHLGR